ncbi:MULTISPECIES: hypothetical protein [Methanobacterium]|uniref:Uncharacterized protein n=1 Tax=Methanobacterium bryantii TaxID=2161 RepID=A0A2A2H8I6_METBR|nr:MULTISPECIES: hypothetical protein [Methanobacterium]OEC84399.1 hypothetical protein A9507_02345 [Methanobacterium sp. A39]PAV05604.1 hypothetical protein ASJ80_08835 [Methanobacterium bryantii]
MLDLGIQKGSKDKSDEYNTKFLNQLDPGEEITGEIYIGEMKKRLIKKTEVDEFYVIITDHKNKQKWICGFITSYYPKSGNIYGEKGGRVYSLIDSLNHALNNVSMNVQESYSVNFDTFRKNINENVGNVKIKAVQSWNPNAKACNLEVVDAKSGSPVEKNGTTDLEQLAQNDPAIKIAQDGLLSKDKEITKKNLAFELKTMLDSEDINKTEFKKALQKIDKL